MEYNLGPASASETIVYGSGRGGRQRSNVPHMEVENWLSYMQEQGIERVVCLLDDEQLDYYPTGLLEAYREAFGEDNVLNVGIQDVTLATADQLTGEILPFLEESEQRQQKVVVHCSGGIGRTGHVLAAWLVYRYGYGTEEAVQAVRHASSANRKPREAVNYVNTSEGEFQALMEAAWSAGRQRRENSEPG
jgi:protein-tyrosine phosphatase